MERTPAQPTLGFEDRIRNMMINNEPPNRTSMHGQGYPHQSPGYTGSPSLYSSQNPSQAQPADLLQSGPAPVSSPRQYRQHQHYPRAPQHTSHHQQNPIYSSHQQHHPAQTQSLQAQVQSAGPGRYGGSRRRQMQQQHIQLDPNAYQRTESARNGPGSRGLYQPQFSHQAQFSDMRARQTAYLDQIASVEIAEVDMSAAEHDEKEAFRHEIAEVCHNVCASDPARLPQVSLQTFGSFRSGFATAGSDMDLVIVTQNQDAAGASFSLMEEDLPRVLEKRLLQLGYGARLLSKTRVPIIKLCQKPSPSLLDKLREERYKWEALPNEKKYPHLFPEGDNEDDENGVEEPLDTTDAAGPTNPLLHSANDTTAKNSKESIQNSNGHTTAEVAIEGNKESSPADGESAPKSTQPQTTAKSHPQKRWTRERKSGPLDFPKSGVGIQSDINFFNPLGIHNTHLLRCYSTCDSRVRPMVLLVKSWAKRRQINSSYSGTLSSYGYVLMVLHYLVNIASPPVLPNLQGPWRPNRYCAPPDITRTEVDGWEVDFWRNEDEIRQAVQQGEMSANRETIGSLLLGFFRYYSSQDSGPQFHWMREVLALRVDGRGLVSKEEKGWVRATRNAESDGRTVQQRYLFCIEDPFERAHNVARTVTHNGIVAIRDEFRRAHRILLDIGYGRPSPRDGHLFDVLPVDIADVDGQPSAEHPAEAVPRVDVAPQQNGTPINVQSGTHPSPRPRRPFKDQMNNSSNINADPQTRYDSVPIAAGIASSRNALHSAAPNVRDAEAFPALGSSIRPTIAATPTVHEKAGPRSKPRSRKKHKQEKSDGDPKD